MDLAELKYQSEATLKTKGFPLNVHLPKIEGAQLRRTLREVQDRALALHSTVALACGVELDRVRYHIEKEDLTKHLTPSERTFVRTGDMTQGTSFRLQEEGLLVLAWSLSLPMNIDPFAYCDTSLGRALPSSRLGRTVAQFRLETSSLRPEFELLQYLDLYYRMHWGFVAEPAAATRASGVQQYVATERRRALEWLFAQESWDDIVLDT